MDGRAELQASLAAFDSGPMSSPLPLIMPTSITTSPSSTRLNTPHTRLVDLSDGDKPGSLRSGTMLPITDLSIPAALHALHADELVHFFKHRDRILNHSESYPYFVLRTLKDYAYFHFSTWASAFWKICVLPMNLVDFISIIAFAILATGVLFVVMGYCIIIKISYYPFARASTENKAASVDHVLDEIFDELSDEEVSFACNALSEPMAESKNTDTVRRFDLDIAKLLLQCSALMYKHTDAPLLKALATDIEYPAPGHLKDRDPDTSIPGALLVDELGEEAATKVCAALSEHTEEMEMRDFARKYGLEYVTLSEMHSASSATCGLLYHPAKTFIVLAYKGTSPQEFAEWVTDFTFEPKRAGSWIRGFGKCHGGFFSRIFPDHVRRRTRMPYSTIKSAINICAQQLLKNKPPGTQVNVWTTGHSLGCSLASLVYARHINEPGDFDFPVVIRDAYLFAAPIMCDSTSVHAFNNRMRHEMSTGGHHLRTMWRITNGLDVVAAGLPHQGDHQRWGLSPYNIFSFAHLGSEIQLREAPQRCIVRGSHVTAGSEVRIVSRVQFTKNEGKDGRDGIFSAERSLARAQCKKRQNLPLLGRAYAHGSAYYWVALTDISTGRCKWDEE